MVLMRTLVWIKYFTSRRGFKRMLGKSGYCINMARFSLAQVSSHDSIPYFSSTRSARFTLEDRPCLLEASAYVSGQGFAL